MTERVNEVDCNEQHLQPHWRSLATACFKPKIFIKSSGTEDQKEEKCETRATIEAGESVSGFYQEVLQMPSTASHNAPSEKQKKRKRNETKREATKSPFQKSQLFCLAMRNKAEEIQRLIENSTDVDLNATDDFGWTALMMAACENSADSFRLLLDCGADLLAQDRTGNTALSLARKKNHQAILDAIEEFQNSQRYDELPAEDDEGESGTDFCSDCKMEVSRSSSKSHQSSTVHLFSCKHFISSSPSIKSFGIARSNQGYKLMKTIGWDGQSALGARQNGKLYPVKTVLRYKRTGLGVKQDDPKITHFNAFDTRAVHWQSRPHAATRKEILEQFERDKRNERMLRRELS